MFSACRLVPAAAKLINGPRPTELIAAILTKIGMPWSRLPARTILCTDTTDRVVTPAAVVKGVIGIGVTYCKSLP